MDQQQAEIVLNRFEDICQIIAGSVAETFSAVTEREDAEQDARMLVLSYAGLAPSYNGLGHVGKLIDVEKECEFDTVRVKRVVATMLKHDLERMYGRQLERMPQTVSIEVLPEQLHPAYDMEAAMLSHLDEDQLKLDFPYLTARYLEGLTETELAERLEVSRSTITRKVARERDVFLVKFLTSRGLVVEGNESAEELLEAYGYLKEAGR